jgi:hypothetical protein
LSIAYKKKCPWVEDGELEECLVPEEEVVVSVVFDDVVSL